MGRQVVKNYPGYVQSAGNFCQFPEKVLPPKLYGVSTKGENILDLILTNDEDLFPEVWVEKRGSFSDHRCDSGSER